MNPLNVDWVSALPAATNLVQIAFYLVTGTVVVVGLKSWRRELRGRSKYEAAKNVIAGSYRVRDAIRTVQAPFMDPGEWADRKQSTDESQNEKRIRDSWFAYSNRFRGVTEAFSQWYPAVVEAEALFGSDARARIRDLELCAAKLRAIIISLHKAQLAFNYQPTPIHQQWEHILWGIHPAQAKEKDDKSAFDDGGFQQDLDSAVLRIREYFSAFIK